MRDSFAELADYPGDLDAHQMTRRFTELPLLFVLSVSSNKTSFHPFRSKFLTGHHGTARRARSIFQK